MQQSRKWRSINIKRALEIIKKIGGSTNFDSRKDVKVGGDFRGTSILNWQ